MLNVKNESANQSKSCVKRYQPPTHSMISQVVLSFHNVRLNSVHIPSSPPPICAIPYHPNNMRCKCTIYKALHYVSCSTPSPQHPILKYPHPCSSLTVSPGSTLVRNDKQGTHNSLSLVRCYRSDLQVPVLTAPTGAQ